MNHFEYSTESDLMVSMIDDEFFIVNVVGNPEHGESKGYDLSIHDPRTRDEIWKKIQAMSRKRVQ